MRLLQFLIVIVLLLSNSLYSQQRCSDVELLPGDDNLLEYGLDSTSHWWAITSPFSDRYRLYVDGKKHGDFLNVSKPIFSHYEGKQWGAFVQQNDGLWDMIINDSLYKLESMKPTEIAFSTNSTAFAFSSMKSNFEEIYFGNKLYEVINRVSRLVVSPEGRRLAYVMQQGNLQTLYVNGNEVETFPEISVIGFFYDGSIIYTARQGNQWNVYKNDEQISITYQSISNATMNRFGTTVAVSAQQLNNQAVIWLFSEEYNQPILSQPFDGITSLTLHPSKAVVMAECRRNDQRIVTIQFTEMGGGLSNSKPTFTVGGEQYYFLTCENICSMVIDGVRRILNNRIEFHQNFSTAVKPNGKTFSISSSSSLVVRYIEKDELYSGMILNNMTPPRYNWRTDRYEALGSIQQRLYLLSCKPE
jgi:hypothetical protein